MRRSAPLSLVTLALALAALVAACGGVATPAATAATATPTATAVPTAPQTPEVAVKASDFALDLPDRLPAGIVRVTLENTGKVTHNLLLARLKETKTADEVKAALAKGPAGLAAISDFSGGPAGTPPGERRQVILDLADGQYAALSSAAFSEDKAPDFFKGMLRIVTVDASAGVGKAVPDAAITATYPDGAPVKLSATARTGKQNWLLVLDGKAPHTPLIAKLAAGKTADDLATWLKTRSGSAPADFVGGMHSLSPGKRGWTVLDLAPGNYVVFDSLGAPSDSQPVTFTLQ